MSAHELFAFVILLVCCNALDVDTVIIGAGSSGLTAALRLIQAGQRVAVLESCHEAGGRTRSIELEKNFSVSVGGTFLQVSDTNALQLINELGVNTHFHQGLPLYYTPNMVDSPSLGFKLAALVPVNETTEIDWSDPTIQYLDSLTLEQWIEQQNATEEEKMGVREYFVILESMENQLETISALHAAIFLSTRLRPLPPSYMAYYVTRLLYDAPSSWIRTVRDNLRILYKMAFTPTLMPFNIAQRIEGGTGVLGDALIKEIGLRNIFRGQFVHRIMQEDDHVIVQSTNMTITAKHAVVAISPYYTKHIEFSPQLPYDSTQVINGIKSFEFPNVNVILSYDKPWWKDYNQGVEVLPNTTDSRSRKGFWGPIMDLTYLGDKEGNPGIVRLLTSLERVEHMTDEQLLEDAVKYFAEQYADPKIRKNVFGWRTYKIFVWNRENPLVSAGYIFPTNVLSKYGHALTRPFGRIHWAGAERSPHGVNWIEGAVASGNRAAKEILGKDVVTKSVATMPVASNDWNKAFMDTISYYAMSI